MEPSYYWARGEEAVGPMPESALRTLMEERTIISDTFILQEGDGQQWRLARSVFPDAFEQEDNADLEPKLKGMRAPTGPQASTSSPAVRRGQRGSQITRRINLRASPEPQVTPVQVPHRPPVIKDLFWLFGGLNLLVLIILLPLAFLGSVSGLSGAVLFGIAAACIINALLFFSLAYMVGYLHATARNSQIMIEQRK